MTKNKILFAGFMGAILMSVGAANAAVTTTVATQKYVEQEIGKLGETYQTKEAANTAAADYEKIANRAAAIGEDTADTEYPSVGALKGYVSTALGGVDAETLTGLKDTVEELKKLDVSDIKDTVEKLDGSVTTEGSVAKQIADALTTVSDTYQTKSTEDLQVGTTGGKFRTMTAEEKAALASGIDSTKVAAYDDVVDTVAEITDATNGLQAQINKINDEDNGLAADIKQNATDIKTNADAIKDLDEAINDADSGLLQAVVANTQDIADNAAEIAKKITLPEACQSPNNTCVLMVSGGDPFWTPVTSPVEEGEGE